MSAGAVQVALLHDAHGESDFRSSFRVKICMCSNDSLAFGKVYLSGLMRCADVASRAGSAEWPVLFDAVGTASANPNE